jgi:hypothetical protein
VLPQRSASAEPAFGWAPAAAASAPAFGWASATPPPASAPAYSGATDPDGFLGSFHHAEILDPTLSTRLLENARRAHAFALWAFGPPSPRAVQQTSDGAARPNGVAALGARPNRTPATSRADAPGTFAGNSAAPANATTAAALSPNQADQSDPSAADTDEVPMQVAGAAQSRGLEAATGNPHIERQGERARAAGWGVNALGKAPLLDKAFGLNGRERYQFFPERLIRGIYEGLQQDPWDPRTGTFTPQAVATATDIAALASGRAPFRAPPAGSLQSPRPLSEAPHPSPIDPSAPRPGEPVRPPTEGVTVPTVGPSDIEAFRARIRVPRRHTIAAGRTSVPGLQDITFEGASPFVRDEAGLPRATPGPTEPPSPYGFDQGHAEEDLVNQFIRAVEKLDLKPSDLDGHKLVVYVSNPRESVTHVDERSRQAFLNS